MNRPSPKQTTKQFNSNRFFLYLALWIALNWVLTPSLVQADEAVLITPHPGQSGQVTLSLVEYQRLLEQASTQALPSPSSYAVGQSVLNVVFHQQDGHITATIQARLEVETFASDWTLVPLLGPGAALESALVDGSPVQLVQRTEGLFWLAEKRRKASVQLTYHVDARFSDHAYVASLPVPQAAATQFALDIPQTHIDLAVTPAANVVTEEHANRTTARGTLPSTAAMMVSWRVAVERPWVLSRAEYSGQLKSASQGGNQDSVITWLARIEAEVMIDSEVVIPLVSTATTLVSVEVDGEPATVISEDGRFAVRLAGAGNHHIDVRFLSSVNDPEGVPKSGFDIPDVPVSRFELTLQGHKLVQAEVQGEQHDPLGTASVTTEIAGEQTRATFFIPMSRRLELSWMEAIPADLDVERRANAVIYQALFAAEGVLYGQAAIQYDITRGSARVLEFSLPLAAQVNQVSAAIDAIADWVVLEPAPETAPATDKHIRVFLNREVSGEFILNIAYEQLLADGDDAINIHAPILRAMDVSRQKGMLALLSGEDLALEPQQHQEMSEVGENQLPAFFRNQLPEAVSHTFKYHSDAAQLAVNAVTPERQQGKFNAQIDSLVSIGEVTLKGQVSIENDVKSGVLRKLGLQLPADVNILGVTGPSIRTHSISQEGEWQNVHIEFTREMDGQFRVELTYERIMLDGTAETQVPQVDVLGADVSHGRIAIEALSALEVQPGQVVQLSTLEINELPRQLVLKTTNPILLAYRYVRTDTPFELQLRITRHEEIEVQVAAIDTANYQTLFTTDGLAVTRVQFDVRNSRRQFLRLALPEHSEIWSVFVNGNAQKPAYAADSAPGKQDVLVKMINSATAFPVEMVYATRGGAMHQFGRIESSLPRPDMIVTHSNWDVYVPSSPSYGKLRTNMDVLAEQLVISVKEASMDLLRGAVTNVINGEPLHIELPTQGLLFRFAKLYANQSAEDAHFSLRYVNQGAGLTGLWLSLLATLAAWAGITLLASIQNRRATDGVLPARTLNLPAYAPWVLITAGAGFTTIAITLLGASVIPPSVLSLTIALGLGVWKVRSVFRN